MSIDVVALNKSILENSLVKSEDTSEPKEGELFYMGSTLHSPFLDSDLCVIINRVRQGFVKYSKFYNGNSIGIPYSKSIEDFTSLYFRGVKDERVSS